MDKPIIRPVEAFPMEQQDQTLICLRDPSGLAPEPIMLGMGAYFLVTLFDGTNSTLDLQAAFSHRFGEVIPSEKIRELVTALDRAYFLDSPAFAERVRSVREEFRQSPSRAAALAGLCYETEPSRLRAEIESFFERPNAPGRDALARRRRLPRRRRPEVSPVSSRRISIRAAAPRPTRGPTTSCAGASAPS